MEKLPEKGSELLALALEDLKKCEGDKDYEIDMMFFHLPIGRKCLVCLAGSVMAQTLKLSKDEGGTLSTLFPDEAKKLYLLSSIALNDKEDLINFLGNLSQEERERLEKIEIPHYISWPKKFHSQISLLAKTLEEMRR